MSLGRIAVVALVGFPHAFGIVASSRYKYFTRVEVDAMFDTRFSAFENKIINLLSGSNIESKFNAESCQPPLNVMVN